MSNDTSIKTAKKRKKWKENEAPIFRWILTVVVGFFLGWIINGVLQYFLTRMTIIIPAFHSGGALANVKSLFITLGAFSGFYIGFTIALKSITKTSLKAFVLGADRNKKTKFKTEVFPILGLYLLGMACGLVFSIGKIELRGLAVTEIIFTFILCCAFTWMQTSWEELVFRGLPLRIFCKNKIGFNVKTIIICLVTSGLFMVAHIGNPEVAGHSDLNFAIVLASYCVSGIGLFLVDMLAGNLLPGLLIHCLNNMVCFFFLDAAVSVSGGTSILVDHSTSAPVIVLAQTIIAYIPVIIYLIRKRKKQLTKSEATYVVA